MPNYLTPVNEVAGRLCFQSCLYVCLSVGGVPCATAPQICSFGDPATYSNFFTWGPSDLFKQVHLGKGAVVLGLKSPLVL